MEYLDSDGKIYIRCPVCGKTVRNAPNRKRCPECQKKYERIYQQEYAKERRNFYRKLGLCVLCGEKTQDGKAYCEKCLSKIRTKRKGKNEERNDI